MPSFTAMAPTLSSRSSNKPTMHTRVGSLNGLNRLAK